MSRSFLLQPNINLATKNTTFITSGGTYYQDYPGSTGNGTYAQSYAIFVPTGTRFGKLTFLSVRIDAPAAVGEQSIIRLYLYRKTGPDGDFSYSQMTEAYVVDSNTPWSWTVDITDHIYSGYIMNPITDSIAVSNVYSNGGIFNMRALRVDFQTQYTNEIATSGPLGMQPATPILELYCRF